MKRLLTAGLGVLCLAVLVYGYLDWNNRTTVKVEPKEQVSTEVIEEPIKDKAAASEDNTKYLKNWPAESVESYKTAIAEKRPIKILLAGSKSLGSETSGWASQVKQELIKTFGETNMAVDILTFDLTSDQFVREEKSSELTATKADMVIFEPLTLNDNGEVSVGNSHKNIQSVIDDVQTELPNTVFILQPPHPLHNANYYPIQVEALKEFAESNDIPYLDHWTVWPDPSTDEIVPMLTANQDQPSEEGHALWAKFVLDYLISKE